MNSKQKNIIAGVIVIIVVIIILVLINNNLKSSSNTPPITIQSDDIAGPVAYIGCSNSQMTVEGYHTDGGTRMWKAITAYNGQTIVKWAEALSKSESSVWQAFDNANQERPGAKIMWFSICAFDSENPVDIYNSSVIVIAEAKKRIPTLQYIYVSGLNEFIPAGSCELTGATGVQKTLDAGNELVKNGYALPGPVISSLSSSETMSNGCHPLPGTAREKEGQSLLNFFQ